MNILKFALIGGLLLLAGCETTSSIPYEVSTGNIMKMRANVELDNAVRVEEFDIANGVNQNPMCRLMGPVKVSPGKTMMQFIKDAFEKEVYEAGLLDLKSPVVIKGRLEKIEFSSVSPASWDLTLRLQSSNGSTLTVTNNYGFATSFSAYGACKNVADAFGPAVQILLGMAIENPEFPSLFARNNSLTYPAKTEEPIIEQALEPDQPVSKCNVSGTYISEITVSGNAGPTKNFMKKNNRKKITLKQIENAVTGADSSRTFEINGTCEGNLINFYIARGNQINGVWRVNTDTTRLEGKWNTDGHGGASGRWNLTKVE